MARADVIGLVEVVQKLQVSRLKVLILGTGLGLGKPKQHFCLRFGLSVYRIFGSETEEEGAPHGAPFVSFVSSFLTQQRVHLTFCALRVESRQC